MKKISILFLLVLLPLIASAYTVKINDIYYDLNGKDYTATVTNNGNILGGSYKGTVIIPEKVNYTVSNKNYVFYVRKIGAEAFYNSSVRSVKIPYTVTSIGGSAFSGCSDLTSVTIPKGVTSIGQNAFRGCFNLRSIEIPNSVTSIGGSAFSGCSGLKSITIPSSVTSIGDNAFDGCNLPSVIVSAGNTKYDSRDDCNAIIETATNTLIVGSYNTVIPNSVTSIGKSAFYNCYGLTSVTIPNSVKSIGSNAFSGCSGLKSFSIGNSVKSIGSNAFSGCSGLKSFSIGNSVTSIGSYAFSGCSGLKSVSIGNSVTSIGYYAFYNCSGLTSVTIPQSVTSIGDDAFENCSSLTQVTLNSNDIVSKSYSSTSTLSSFFGKQVKAYILGNSVTSIGSNAFQDCTGLTSVTIPQSVKSIGSNAFYNCSGLTSIEIPNSVTSIGWDAFYNCSGLTSIEIPNSVTSIGSNAFYGCSGLTSITIPNSVKSIGSDAFYNCSSLTSVRITDIAAWCKISFIDYDGNPLSYAHHLYLNGSEVKDLVIPNSVTSIGSYAFSGCSGLTSVTIPNSVTSIGSNAFYNCSGLTSVTIPNSVTSIGSIVGSAFSGCSGLTSIIVERGNTKYDSRDNCNAIIVTATNTLIAGCKNTVIPNSVTSIGKSAFRGCSGLTSVTIPNSVASIDQYAFDGCSGLTSVTCEATSVPLTEISSTVFFRVPQSSATLYVPASALETYKKTEPWSSFGTIKTIKYDGIYYEFDKTTKQATVISGDEKYTGIVNIPETVTYNGEAYSVTSIGTDAFRGCSSLTSVTIPKSVTKIEEAAFYNCSGLKSVSIGNSVTSIGNWAFYNCSGLTSVTIPNSVKSIGNYAFYKCSGLKNVYCYAENVPSTGSNVFSNVPQSSATLYVPASALETYKKTEPWSSFGTIKTIKYDGIYYEFDKTTKQATVISGDEKYTGIVNIPETVTYNGEAYSVTSIGKDAFYGCSSLTSVTIPKSVTSIGSNAFADCSGLTSVHVTDLSKWCNIYFSTTYSNPLYFAKHLFMNGKEITDLVIPNSVTSIGWGAFWGCSGLTSITIPNSVTSIGNYAFYKCSGLNSVTCEATSVPSTGSDVFASSNIANATLYVPSSSVNAYKKTAPWSSFGNILALPEPLNYYDYGLTMKTLIYKTEWADVLNSVPNAVAVAEAELEEWAASQTNVIVKKNNAYYCPNFILTDLTEIAGSGYEKTGFYSPYDFTVKKGSYRRQAYAGYNTICVPFSFTASDLSGTAKTYAFEHYDDGEGKAIFKRVKGTIAAGTPCIVKESGNVVWNINLANKKISASSSSEDSHMRGTFVSTDVYQGKGYSPNSANEFSPLSQYLHPFRACLILGSVSGARAIRLVLDDAVTDIDEVEVDSATLKNGKYLEKGKLVIYKSGRKYNANGSTIK